VSDVRAASTVVIVLLTPVRWAPPGIDLQTWREALAEDVVDLLAPLPQIQPAIAAVEADLEFAAKIGWPTMPVYEVKRATPLAALAAGARDGHQRGAVIFADAPDLPAMLVGKLLRPLTTREVAVAPATDSGLLGVAALLPVPEWLPDLDTEVGNVVHARAAAPRPTMVAAAPAWHRIRTPLDLQRLDPALDGWDATRALLAGRRY
jgi:hypothetical protein